MMDELEDLGIVGATRHYTLAWVREGRYPFRRVFLGNLKGPIGTGWSRAL